MATFLSPFSVRKIFALGDPPTSCHCRGIEEKGKMKKNCFACRGTLTAAHTDGRRIGIAPLARLLLRATASVLSIRPPPLFPCIYIIQDLLEFLLTVK